MSASSVLYVNARTRRFQVASRGVMCNLNPNKSGWHGPSL
jgi:hypothetical protein